jgi:hypothetical protein
MANESERSREEYRRDARMTLVAVRAKLREALALSKRRR